MHIAVNTRMLIPGKLDGFGWFAHEVLSRITLAHPEIKFTFYFDRKFDDQFIYNQNVEPMVLFPPARHPELYKIYFDYSIPLALRKSKPDLFFSPDGFLSLKTKTKQIGVIHDINFEHRPQDLPKAYSKYYRNRFRKFAEISEQIITVSEYSRQDIVSTYGIDALKIQVAHNGANNIFKPVDEFERAQIENRYSQGSPYFVFVGNFSYRKNIHGIIKSYDLYRKKGNHKLLLVGNPLWTYDEMNEALNASPYKDDIFFPGHLSQEDLVKIVAAAKAMIFPSYFEGFGIPIVEAFKAGTPVITSNRTSLPEVAGNAALICEPDDHEKISDFLFSLESNDNQRIDLINKGYIRAELFHWDNTANKVKSVLFDTLNNVR